MTDTTEHQHSDTQPVENQAVAKKRSKRIRYVNLTAGDVKLIPPCQECGAARYSIGNGSPSQARMFTPHADRCSVPRRLFIQSERLADYAKRKAIFLRHYEERISYTRH